MAARWAGIRAAEEGAALIEVLVSAVLLIVLAVGITGGLDGTAKVSAANRERSVAANLAQQDQERLRGFKIADLSNYRETRNVTAGGISYRVDSRTDWVQDANGVVSCTSGTGQASYLKISSTVTPPTPAGQPGRPVTETSLRAPSAGAFSANQGSAAISVMDRAGVPLVGVPVTIDGPTSLADTTNALGCAVFGYIPAGDYQVSFSLPGYVDATGAGAAGSTKTVTAGNTNQFSFVYDRAAQIAVSFDTKVGSAAARPATGQSVTFANANLPAPGTRAVTASPTPASPNTITVSNLFPFQGGYGVYAGSCASADPTTYDPNYYSSNPGLVNVAPGGSYSVTVREPAINLVVVDDHGNIASDAQVQVDSTDSGCTEPFPSQTTSADGTIPNPGFPFGSYAVCADAGKKHRSVNVQNTSPGGTPTIVLKADRKGSCK